MQSRMDRYNNVESSNTQVSSRTSKNQGLYEKIKTSEIKRHDVNNNMSVIDDNIKTVDINKIHNFLDEKYGENTAKRRSIALPEIEEKLDQDPIMDTKEYDINAIIEKAKQGKNIDYSKERLKKVREAQYEILSNLDSKIENLSSLERAKEKRKQQEENLKELIHTITEIELNNKMKDTASDFDLLSDLLEDSPSKEEVKKDDEDTKEITMDENTINELKNIEITNEVPEITTEVEDNNTSDETDTNIVIGGVQQEQNTINSQIVVDEPKEENNEESYELDKTTKEKTLTKLQIDPNEEEFFDINEKDKSSFILKIIIFIIFIILILGALYILNNLLGLGLLPF